MSANGQPRLPPWWRAAGGLVGADSTITLATGSCAFKHGKRSGGAGHAPTPPHMHAHPGHACRQAAPPKPGLLRQVGPPYRKVRSDALFHCSIHDAADDVYSALFHRALQREVGVRRQHHHGLSPGVINLQQWLSAIGRRGVAGAQSLAGPKPLLRRHPSGCLEGSRCPGCPPPQSCCLPCIGSYDAG